MNKRLPRGSLFGFDALTVTRASPGGATQVELHSGVRMRSSTEAKAVVARYTLIMIHFRHHGVEDELGRIGSKNQGEHPLDSSLRLERLILKTIAPM